MLFSKDDANITFDEVSKAVILKVLYDDNAVLSSTFFVPYCAFQKAKPGK